MAAGKTYEPIATTTLGSAQSTVTFSSISQGYTDLVVVCSVKNTTGAAGFKFRLNNDTGSNYSTTVMYGSGSSAGSARESNAFGLMAYLGYTDNTSFGTYIQNFQNYSNATTYKTILGRSNNVNGGGLSALVNLWRNTNPITSILLYPDANQFAIGSTFSIYGISAA
jgi:hypothetical protein